MFCTNNQCSNFRVHAQKPVHSLTLSYASSVFTLWWSGGLSTTRPAGGWRFSVSGRWTGATAGGGEGGGSRTGACTGEKVLRNYLLQIFINVTWYRQQTDAFKSDIHDICTRAFARIWLSLHTFHIIIIITHVCVLSKQSRAGWSGNASTDSLHIHLVL